MNGYLRYKVLEAIAPPYSTEFVQLFLPMVEDEEITGTMRGESESDLVSEFIGKHKSQFTIDDKKYFCHFVNLIFFLFFSTLQDT